MEEERGRERVEYIHVYMYVMRKCLLQASVLSSQERLNYVASFGDKKEYIALIEQQLSRCRYE